MIVGGVTYGDGEKLEEEGEEIAQSENPMLNNKSLSDIIGTDYRNKTTKIKFAIKEKVPSKKIDSWDVSNAGDGSVMAWIESDGNEGYIFTIAGKNKIIANSSCYELFDNFLNVTEIENLQILDTSNVTNMNRMFNDCRNVTNLNLSNFNTINVTNMSNMFSGCSNIISLNLSSFDTSKVANMTNMFSSCNNLENINFGENFNTNNVIGMSSMFSNCNTIKELDLRKFDTGKITSMQAMFSGCRSLTNLNLTSFNTSNVIDMNYMFRFCESLENLDLSSFDTSNVTTMNYMFERIPKLKTTLNITGKAKEHRDMFRYSLTDENAKVILNYSDETSDLVDGMIETNVIKGTKI